MPSGLFSLRLTFECSKSESLHDITVTRIVYTFPTVFCRLSWKFQMKVLLSAKDLWEIVTSAETLNGSATAEEQRKL